MCGWHKKYKMYAVDEKCAVEFSCGWKEKQQIKKMGFKIKMCFLTDAVEVLKGGACCREGGCGK